MLSVVMLLLLPPELIAFDFSSPESGSGSCLWQQLGAFWAVDSAASTVWQVQFTAATYALSFARASMGCHSLCHILSMIWYSSLYLYSQLTT